LRSRRAGRFEPISQLHRVEGYGHDGTGVNIIRGNATLWVTSIKCGSMHLPVASQTDCGDFAVRNPADRVQTRSLNIIRSPAFELRAG
jgi:hypothetical protein